MGDVPPDYDFVAPFGFFGGSGSRITLFSPGCSPIVFRFRTLVRIAWVATAPAVTPAATRPILSAVASMPKPGKFVRRW
jgi:hypothetical protein